MLAEHIHPHVGGVEKHISELNTILVGWGHQIVLWAPKFNDQLPFFEKKEGVDIYRITKTRSRLIDALKTLAWWFQHLDLIKSADLVHFHGSFPLFHWFFPLRVLFPFKPMFITYHGCGMTVPPIRREATRNRLAQFFTRGNICIGHFLEKWHRLKPSYVSYGGVKIPSNFPSSRENAAVYVGRLDEDTGVELYLQALAILKETFRIEIPLTICGDGAARAELEEYCSKKGLDVTFEGFVDNPFNYLIRHQFAFVSGYLSILEAMAAQGLVFSVYKNEIKEDYLKLLPDADKMMIINADPPSLAEDIKRVLEEKDAFSDLRKRASAFVKDQSWEKLAKTYIELWDK
jgi:glycosyltransferase involved in cell wall biosynthesis